MEAMHTKTAFRLGAQERFLMSTNVNTPFFQVPTPEFEYKVSTLYSGIELGINISGTLNTAPFCASALALVLGHQV